MKNKIKFTYMEKAILKFSAVWCKPCKEIAPFYLTLSKEFPNITFCEIDIDENEEFANMYNVTGMPTFISLYKGEEISRFSGADKNQLRTLSETLNKMT